MRPSGGPPGHLSVQDLHIPAQRPDQPGIGDAKAGAHRRINADQNGRNAKPRADSDRERHKRRKYDPAEHAAHEHGAADGLADRQLLRRRVEPEGVLAADERPGIGVVHGAADVQPLIRQAGAARVAPVEQALALERHEDAADLLLPLASTPARPVTVQVLGSSLRKLSRTRSFRISSDSGINGLTPFQICPGTGRFVPPKRS